MPIEFPKSETQKNLLRAFAGESQARNRYTFAASMAKKQNLQVIEGVFTYTAKQELAHAKVYYKLLQPSCGATIAIDGTYPVDLYPTVLEQLRAAERSELGEWQHDYAEFSKAAQEEGYPEIATTFSEIGEIEKTHSERFGRFADLLEDGKLFSAEAETKWVCLNCGNVVTAIDAPLVCGVCKHPQGYFIRLGMAPFQP